MSDDLYIAITKKYPGRKIEIDVSEDGENFTTIANLKHEIPLMQEGKFKHAFAFEDKQITARYLRVSAKNTGKLPQEHPAAGSDAWIFVDEIIIE